VAMESMLDPSLTALWRGDEEHQRVNRSTGLNPLSEPLQRFTIANRQEIPGAVRRTNRERLPQKLEKLKADPFEPQNPSRWKAGGPERRE